jgi:recombination protein RecA
VGDLKVRERPAPQLLQTGIPAVDQYGIPKGALTQLCAPPEVSSGRTAVLFSLMAQLTKEGSFCALVDAGDCFNPAAAERSGIDLNHLLWVRCRRPDQMRAKMLVPLEQAFKAADILVQNGGFGLIAVDLASIPEAELRRVPLTTWFRFARVVEKTDTALVFLVSYPAARSCAGLTLQMQATQAGWSEVDCNARLSHACFLESAECEMRPERSRGRKPVQSVMSGFTAATAWK